MAKVLISCVGTGRKDTKEVSKREYEKATYVLEGKDYETAFVSFALYQHYDIEKIILVGTVKSMWEEVYRAFTQFNGQKVDEDKILNIGAHCDSSNSTSELTIPYQSDIEKAMGKDSHIVLLNYGLNEEELQNNSAIILGIEQYLNRGDELYVDITHSFRSIPIYMMNLLMYLRFVSNKNIKIINISYGMFEAKNENNGKTPIIDISSLLNINDWLVGAYSFTEFGQSYQIAKHMGDMGNKEVAKRLTTFSDVMSLGYLDGIKRQISNISAMKNMTFSPIPNAIIPQTINNYLSEFDNSNNAVFQYSVAVWYYKHNNYACAYISLLEAILTYVQETCDYDFGSPIGNNDFAKTVLTLGRTKDNFSREEVNKARQKLIKKRCYDILKKAAEDINSIRNGIAHQKNVKSVQNSDKLIKNLKDSINLLAPIFNKKPIK